MQAGKGFVEVTVGDDPRRGSGRTTGLMLKAIEGALLNPGEWVEFVDHTGSVQANNELAYQIERMAAACGLRYMHVRMRPRDKTVWVVSLPPIRSSCEGGVERQRPVPPLPQAKEERQEHTWQPH